MRHYSKINVLKIMLLSFLKQWGGVNKKKNGRLLNGKLWSQMPKLKLPIPILVPA